MPPPLVPTYTESYPDSTAAANNRADFASEKETVSAAPAQAADGSAQELQQDTDAATAEVSKQENVMPQNSDAHAEKTEEASSNHAQNEAAAAESTAEQVTDQPEDTAEPSCNTAQKGEDAEQAGEAENKGTQSPGEAADDPAADGHFPTAEEIRQVICDVVDPEINISIIDLGLVYDIIPNPEDRTVHINMTLTSPGCPLGPEITAAVYLKVTRIPGVRDCQVDLVWSPMWDPAVNPTEETRMALGIW